MNNAFSYNPSEYLGLLTGSLKFILPEIVIALVFLGSIILELIFGKKKSWIVPGFSILGILLAGVLIPIHASSGEGLGQFLGMIDADNFASLFKYLFFAGAGIIHIVGFKSRSIPRPAGEYHIILNGLLLGMLFMAMARNLLMIYLAMETVSLASYILTAYDLRKRKAAEASLKYFIYGAFVSGIMIYAISWIYGLTGTLDPGQPEFAIGLEAMGTFPLLLVSVMLLGGFAFKIGAAPFHFWAPDVYEASPYPVAAFFSIGPKIAGFAMLMRFMWYFGEAAPPALLEGLIILLSIIAIMSMFIGNFAALRQTKLRRLIAYSSIAQAGTALLGVLVLSPQGFAAVVFYLLIYFLMNLGLFLFAGFVEEESGITEISALSGTAKFLRTETVLVAILLAGLVGLPPTGGFISKLYVFIAVFQEVAKVPWFWALLIIAVVNTVISLFYYMKLPAGMVFRKYSGKKPFELHTFQLVILIILTLPVLLMGIYGFDGLIGFIQAQLPDIGGLIGN